jgi:uncharacterized protein YnzC (UPF0291/DUF896 family)
LQIESNAVTLFTRVRFITHELSLVTNEVIVEFMSVSIAHHEADILERAIDTSSDGWSAEIARGFLSIKLSSADIARMNELAARAQADALDGDEALEIESYRSAARLLEILKLRARATLKRANLLNPPSA